MAAFGRLSLANDRRLSMRPSENGSFQTPLMPSSQAGSNNLGQPRHSLAGGAPPGRQSLGPSRVSRPPQPGAQLEREFGALNLSNSNHFGDYGVEAKLNGGGRTSLAPRQSLEPRHSLNNRRSSAFSGTAAVPTGPVGKDPRPIREKSFQLGCIKLLLDFLVKSGYDKPISQKILTAPSSKDFQHIFRFLYAQLDSSYEFGKKFEEEVPVAMKGLRYPYAGEISKSQLYAVGSMHAWPGLLAMLAWMVELILCCDELDAQLEFDNAAEAEDENSPASAKNNPEKFFFEYLCKAYKVFLAGNDDYSSMITELAANFERKNEAILGQIDRLGRSVALKEEEFHILVGEESPLLKSQKERALFMSDGEKFRKFVSHLSIKKSKFVEVVGRLKEEIAALEKEIEEAEIQKATLQAQVDAQDVCPEDIDRMNADKDQLVKTLESVAAAKEDASKVFWDRELQVQKKLDVVERAIQEYTFLGERVAIIPVEAANANNEPFELVFNPHANKIEAMINHDLRIEIQPRLIRLRDNLHASVHESQDMLIALQENLDRLIETTSDKQEELAMLEEKIKKLGQQYNEEKEMFTSENHRSSSEVEQLEVELQRMRGDMSSNYLASQQALQRVTIQWDQTVSRTAEEKERVGKEIFRILEELINFKTLVEGSLTELEAIYAHELA